MRVDLHDARKAVMTYKYTVEYIAVVVTVILFLQILQAIRS